VRAKDHDVEISMVWDIWTIASHPLDAKKIPKWMIGRTLDEAAALLDRLMMRPPTRGAYWFIVVVKICPQSHWKVSRSDRGESECGPVSLPTRRILRGHAGQGIS
jgi:hypothetical protein